MAVETQTSFDIETLKRAYEQWDLEALLACYADDVELIQIDRDNPRAPAGPAWQGRAGGHVRALRRRGRHGDRRATPSAARTGRPRP